MNLEFLLPTSRLNSLFHTLVFVIKKMNKTVLSSRRKKSYRKKCNKIIIFTIELFQNKKYDLGAKHHGSHIIDNIQNHV